MRVLILDQTFINFVSDIYRNLLMLFMDIFLRIALRAAHHSGDFLNFPQNAIEVASHQWRVAGSLKSVLSGLCKKDDAISIDEKFHFRVKHNAKGDGNGGSSSLARLPIRNSSGCRGTTFI